MFLINSFPTNLAKLKKKIVIDGREALANIVKISAMDALRMSGQKQQIKLKLKPSDSAKFNPELVPASVIDSVTEGMFSFLCLHPCIKKHYFFADIPVPSRKRSIDSVESDASKVSIKAMDLPRTMQIYLRI
jgi:hypothetical protein